MESNEILYDHYKETFSLSNNAQARRIKNRTQELYVNNNPKCDF